MATTVPVLNTQLESINDNLSVASDTWMRIANKMGAYDEPITWYAYQAYLRLGRIANFLKALDQVKVAESAILTVGHSGTGITDATAAKDTFIAVVDNNQGTYEFDYNGSVWELNGTPVTLADYGISTTGTAVEGDAIIVRYTATDAIYDVAGIDEEVPADANYDHVITLMRNQCMGLLQFDPPQYLFPVTAESLADLGISGSVLPAGTYDVTLFHGAYDGGTNQDGTYYVTTTVPIPIGGGIRHSSIGSWQSSAYTVAQIVAGTWTTYGADRVTVLESGLATAQTGSGSTNLGTTTASNPTYKTGDYINFSQRNAYGSNRWSTSLIRQILNSFDATVSFVPGTIWSRPMTTMPEGFLHSIDGNLRACLGKVRKRYAFSISDGYGYEDVEDYVTLATMMDVFGGQNNSIYEGPVTSDGTIKRNSQYTLWKDSTNADRIKTYSAAARNWWLASVLPSRGYNVRLVSGSGSLNNYDAYFSCGVVPCLHII